MKYRVYATILGYVLPKKRTDVTYKPGAFQREIKTTIKKMTFAEQKKRHFEPIKLSKPNTTHYKRYLTNDFGTDRKILRSDFIIYTDIEVWDSNAAIGAAIQIFDKIVGALALNASILFLNKYKRHLLHQKYDYQVVRVYELEDKKEKEPKEKLGVTGWVAMPNWPQGNVDFGEINKELLQATLESRNEVFKKALHYSTEGNKSFDSNEPVQVAFLNWIKAIEIIVNEFKGNTFKKRLSTASNKLGLEQSTIDQIKKAWNVRSNGDFAHARKSSGNYLPPQYPVPKDQDFIPYDMNTIATTIIVRYFELVDGIIEVRVHKDHPYEKCDRLNELIAVNMAEYFEFHTHTLGKAHIIRKIKKSVAEHFNIRIGKIKIVNRKNTGLTTLRNDYYYFKVINQQYSIYRS